MIGVVRLTMFPECHFFFNDTATTEIYTLSLHDALPISGNRQWWVFDNIHRPFAAPFGVWFRVGSGWLPRAGPFPQRIGTAAPPMQVPSPPPSRCPAPLLRCPPRWRAADVGGVDRAGCSLHLRPGRLAAWSPLTENPWLADSEAAGFGCLVSVGHHLAF